MTWHQRPSGKEHVCQLDSGFTIVLYRDAEFPKEWCWRVIAAHDPERKRTYTDNIPDAKRIACRGADLLFRQAIEQNTAELVLLGTNPG